MAQGFNKALSIFFSRNFSNYHSAKPIRLINGISKGFVLQIRSKLSCVSKNIIYETERINLLSRETQTSMIDYLNKFHKRIYSRRTTGTFSNYFKDSFLV